MKPLTVDDGIIWCISGENISADMGFRCFRWAGGQVGMCHLVQF